MYKKIDGFGCLVAASTLLASVSASPQAPAVSAEPADEELAEVVVVGALTRAEVDAAQIELHQAADLSDVFRGIPSVAVGGSVGIAQKIYVRGLEDTQLNVTVDGAPQHGTLFHHIGRVSIEPELLDTVQVQAGAGEATAGFGAIGGAIRFRTRDATDLLAPDQQFGAMARASWFSNDGRRLSGTVYGRVFGGMGVLASFVDSDRDDMKDGGGNRLHGTGGDQQLAFLKFGGQMTDAQRLSLSFEQREEKAAFGQRPNWPALESDPLYPAEGRRRTAVLNHGVNLSNALALESTLYWTQSKFTQDIFDRWGRYGAAIRTRGADLRAHLAAGSHGLVIGTEYRHDVVHSEYLDEPATWQDWAWDAAIGRFVEKGQLFGLYAQDHWQAGDRLLVSYGARYDRYELDQVTYGDGTDSGGVSGNLGLRYDLTEALALHGSFAQAFRGKEIGDAFTLEKRPGRIALQPGLDAERVENLEAGLSFDSQGWRSSAVYYDMRIDDVIMDQLGNGPAPQAPVYFENVGRFEADGVELRAGYATQAWSVDGYFNHYRSKLNGALVEGYEQIGLGNSVGDNWNLTFGYRPRSTLSLEASLTRYEALNDIEVLHRGVEIGWIDSTQRVDKPAFTVVDLFGQWQPFARQGFTIGAAVYNLFDKSYRAHASVADYSAIEGWEGVAGLREPGRNFRLSVTMRF